MDIFRDYEVFLQYLLVVIAANCENRNESDKLLDNERDSECYKLVVLTVKCTRLMRLVR